VLVSFSDRNTVNFKVKTLGPAILAGQATPSKVSNNARMPVLITAQVVHYAGQDHIASVKIDLSETGGSAAQELKDDGTGGDKVAGDGIYSYSTVIQPSVALGPKGLLVVATDKAALLAKSIIGLEVMSEISGTEPGEYQIVIDHPGQKITLKYSATEAGFLLQIFKPKAASPIELTLIPAVQTIEFENAEVGTWKYKVIKQSTLPSTRSQSASLQALNSASGQYMLATTTAGTGIVFGSVTEIETGNPVNNASISTTVGASAVSQEGYYLLLGPAGVFTLTVSDAVHQPASKSVNLITGSSVEADILLQLKSSGGGSMGTCPIEAAFAAHEGPLNLLRSFRDTFLSRSSLGMACIAGYYQFAPEVTAMLERSPALKEKIRTTVVALLPAIRKWSGNEACALNASQLAGVRECLAIIKEGGSASLQHEIDMLVSYLDNGQIFKSLQSCNRPSGNSVHAKGKLFY
ncbi:MAG: CFI-box-CTERM domain-containing protein, partial [Pseudomonadota bacterium]